MMTTESPKSLPGDSRADGRLLLIAIVYIGLAALNFQAATMWHIVWPVVVAGLLVLVALLLLKASLPLRTKQSRSRSQPPRLTLVSSGPESPHHLPHGAEVPNTVEALLRQSQ